MKKLMIPNGYHRIAENSNINGLMVVTTYFSRDERKLYITFEQKDIANGSFGPFDPGLLELLTTNLSDVLQMKGAYHAV